jgi:hypothetical protein
MSGSANKRAKPDAVAAYTARSIKSNDARHAVRAAARAIARNNAVSENDEVDTLNEQLDEIDESEDDESSRECDIIKNRFKRLAKDYNNLAASKSNRELWFTCSVCLDNRLVSVLRILAPCGHGFCSGCVEAVMTRNADGQDPAPTCPTCRGVIASAITPYF